MLVALVWDLSGRQTQLAPFASDHIDRGAVIAKADVEWRPVPDGLFPIVSPIGATAAIPLVPGDPISASTLTQGFAVPSDWWTVPIPTPTAAISGVRVRLVLPNGDAVTGVVVEPSREDSFGLQSAGLVAVPPAAADAIGLAADADQLVVLYAP